MISSNIVLARSNQSTFIDVKRNRNRILKNNNNSHTNGNGIVQLVLQTSHWIEVTGFIPIYFCPSLIDFYVNYYYLLFLIQIENIKRKEKIITTNITDDYYYYGWLKYYPICNDFLVCDNIFYFAALVEYSSNITSILSALW